MLTLIEELDKRDKWHHRLGLYQCHCGKEKEIIIKDVNNNKVKSCGCSSNGGLKTHGMAGKNYL